MTELGQSDSRILPLKHWKQLRNKQNEMKTFMNGDIFFKAFRNKNKNIFEAGISMKN